jgi:hypothetical protein
MRRLIRVSGFVAGLTLVSMLTVPASAQTEHSARSAHELWLVVTPGESFTNAVLRAARAPGGGRAAVTIEAMLKQAMAGQAVYVPQGTRHDVISVRATIPELRSTLSAVRSLGVHHAGVLRSDARSHVVPSYDVRGYGCNPVIRNHDTVDATWCDLELQLAGDVCDPECQRVDTLTATVTTNPGAVKSAASYTLKNVVTTGFSTVFAAANITWTTLCYRGKDACGSRSTGNVGLNSSGKMGPTSDIPLWGDTITHSYVLTALFIPNGQKYTDGADTGSATCETKSEGNQCFYPT